MSIDFIHALGDTTRADARKRVAKSRDLRLHLSDTVPAGALVALRETVVDTDSDTEQTLYLYECGCQITRTIGERHCVIVWCRRHRWES